MAAVVFDPAAFRLLFPAFAGDPPSNATLQAYFDSGTTYIQNNAPVCQGMTLAQLTQALNLMTAHIAAIQVMIAAGETPGQVQGSTVDKVSVTLTPAPQTDQWAWWLGTTPYGQQLLALLQGAAAGGFYFGGRPETVAMRRAGNGWW